MHTSGTKRRQTATSYWWKICKFSINLSGINIAVRHSQGLIWPMPRPTYRSSSWRPARWLWSIDVNCFCHLQTGQFRGRTQRWGRWYVIQWLLFVIDMELYRDSDLWQSIVLIYIIKMFEKELHFTRYFTLHELWTAWRPYMVYMLNQCYSLPFTIYTPLLSINTNSVTSRSVINNYYQQTLTINS